MQIQVDPLSSVPMYQQIRDRVVEGIASGELPAGAKLVSIRRLAAVLEVNVETVVKAYELLRRDGFLRTSEKSGSRIVSGREQHGVTVDSLPEGWSARMTTLIAEAVARGLPAPVLVDYAKAITEDFLVQNRVVGSYGH